jgi:hypothetical protein
MHAAKSSTLAVFVCTALAVIAACSFAPQPAAAADAGAEACTADVGARRAKELRIFRDTMVARRKAFFRSHRSKRLQKGYVQRLNARLAALRAAVAECGNGSTADLVQDNPAEKPPAACAPRMFGVSGAEMNEATFQLGPLAERHRHLAGRDAVRGFPRPACIGVDGSALRPPREARPPRGSGKSPLAGPPSR